MPSPEELLTQPEYYLSELDLGTGECGFLKLDKGAYRRSAFMDHRVRSETRESSRAPLEVMEQLVTRLPMQPESRPINYIFHSAFCCSTLLSRCLDIEGVCYALREPPVLMQMANYKRAGNPYFLDTVRRQALLNTVLFLLAKPAAEGETALIKPTNAANNLAAEIVRHPRTQGVLLLYSNLEQFLVSIIKKGEEGRVFVRRLFNVLRTDSRRSNELPPESIAQLTDLQVAAFVWYLQVDNYLSLLESFPNAKIRTLDCEMFLTQPVTTLTKLCKLFGIAVEVEKLESIVAGPVFNKYSKNETQDYDSSTRDAEYRHIEEEHRTSINSILAWSNHIRSEGPVRLPLPHAL